jgi:hypothetical protein
MTQIINKVTYYFFLFTGFKLEVSKLAWQTLWEVMSFQESQQNLLCFSLLLLNLPFYFLKRAILIWGIAYSVATILF